MSNHPLQPGVERPHSAFGNHSSRPGGLTEQPKTWHPRESAACGPVASSAPNSSDGPAEQANRVQGSTSVFAATPVRTRAGAPCSSRDSLPVCLSWYCYCLFCRTNDRGAGPRPRAFLKVVSVGPGTDRGNPWLAPRSRRTGTCPGRRATVHTLASHVYRKRRSAWWQACATYPSCKGRTFSSGNVFV